MHRYRNNSLAAIHTKYVAFRGTEGHSRTKAMPSGSDIPEPLLGLPYNTYCSRCILKASNCLMVRCIHLGDPEPRHNCEVCP